MLNLRYTKLTDFIYSYAFYSLNEHNVTAVVDVKRHGIHESLFDKIENLMFDKNIFYARSIKTSLLKDSSIEK